MAIDRLNVAERVPCRRMRWCRLASELAHTSTADPAAVSRLRRLLVAELAALARETADGRLAPTRWRTCNQGTAS